MLYGNFSVETIAYVKGGMPVQINCNLCRDHEGDDVTDVEIRWANTGKLVTAKFEQSLTGLDWAKIDQAISDSMY